MHHRDRSVVAGLGWRVTCTMLPSLSVVAERAGRIHNNPPHNNEWMDRRRSTTSGRIREAASTQQDPE